VVIVFGDDGGDDDCRGDGGSNDDCGGDVNGGGMVMVIMVVL
jgi:hypothetical protein